MADELRELVEILDGIDRPLEVRVRHELQPESRRLLDSLGVRIVVDAAAAACVRRCGRRECRVTELRMQRAVSLGHAVPTPSRVRTSDEPKQEPKSAEQLRTEEQERRDAQEIATLCGFCNWRFLGTAGEGRERAAAHRADAHPEAIQGKRPGGYSPRRTQKDDKERREAMEAVERRRRTTHADDGGLDALARMDAGLPQEPEQVLDEEAAARMGDVGASSSSPELEDERAAAVGHAAVSGAADSSGEPERAAANSTPAPRRTPKPHGYWTLETCVAGFQEHHRRTGAAPKTTLLNGSTGPLPDYLPAWTIVRRCGGYAAVLEAAGLEAPARSSTRGTRSRRLSGEASTTRSEREPQADGHALEAAAPPNPRATPSASAKQPAAATPSRSDITGWIKVDGTGLAYRNPDEAYVAADEIEADGDRVAHACRDDGNEERADQAVDQAHELAEKIRAAARAAEERATAHRDPTKRVEATTTPEGREGWGQPRHPELEGEGDDDQDVVPTRSPKASEQRPADEQHGDRDVPGNVPTAAVELREAPPGSVAIPTPLTRLLAKLPPEELEQAVAEYETAIARLQNEMAIVDYARDQQREAA